MMKHTLEDSPDSGKPQQVRLRVKKACDRCKKQKTKCDGEFPCFTCSRHGHHCEYSANVDNTKLDYDRKKHSAKRPEELKNSSSYIQYLESRVRNLETQLAQGGVSVSSDYNNEMFNKNLFAFSRDKYRVMRRYQNLLPYEFGKTIFDSLPENHRKDLIIPRIQFYGWNMSGMHYLKQRKLPPFEPLIDLTADKELADWLIDFFFRKINPLFSIIHESVFRDQLVNYLKQLDQKLNESSRLFTSILYLIFAISIRFSENHPSLPPHLKAKLYPRLEEKLFASGHAVVEKLSFEWQSFELIQSWILITLYLRTTHRQNSSWFSLGVALRMTKGMSLNLNRIPEVFSKKTYEQLKIKRIFWLVYTWDRIYGFQSGKNFEITDDVISMPLPEWDDEDDWLEKPALAMIKLADIVGKIQIFMLNPMNNENFNNIQAEMRKWEKETSARVVEGDELLLHQLWLTYHDVYLSFHNKTLFKLLDRQVSNESDNDFSKILRHSSEVLKIFNQINEANLLLVPWWLNLVLLFNLSLIDIILINTGLYRVECQNNLKICLGYLTSLKEHTGMAKECLWALKMLNHMVVTRFKFTMEQLTEIGIDHGSDQVNKVKFLQFGKVDQDEANPTANVINNHAANNTPNNNNQTNNENTTNEVDNLIGIDMELYDSGLNDDLLGNLKWFDQWVSELNN